MKELQNLWSSFVEMIRNVEFSPINDTIDILLVTAILYVAFKFLRDRRAGKLAAGVALFFIVLIISDVAEMRALNFILSSLTQAGLVALLIIFQPELRSALEKMGNGSIKNIKGMFTTAATKEMISSFKEMGKAVDELADSKTGALIVFERDTKLGDVIKSGTIVDAGINSMLINNIFYNKAPLHDGAMVIRNNRVFAAGCFLPLSQNQDIIKELGTRHRAGIGISEVSDAIVIIVSEETGMVSVAIDGKLRRGFRGSEIEKILVDGFLTESGGRLGKIFGKEGNDEKK